MPFTPFHFGPGLALKALAGERFSFIAFGMAQVAMDLEPLVGIFSDALILHGPSHTYLGATGIALAAGVGTALLGRPLLRRWNFELGSIGFARLAAGESSAAAPVALGAFLGTYSHVALDSIMHADMKPWAPWSHANGLLGIVSLETLHAACGLSAALGIALWVGRQWRMGRNAGRND